MKFTKSSEPLATTGLAAAEHQTGLRLPAPVRAAYLSANGGVPERYVFENDEVDTVVSEFLPLASAVQSYARLVREKRLVPPRFLPFVVDAGGDYFFVDCAAPPGAVHCFRGDAAAPRLVDFRLSFEQFWASLKTE